LFEWLAGASMQRDDLREEGHLLEGPFAGTGGMTHPSPP